MLDRGETSQGSNAEGDATVRGPLPGDHDDETTAGRVRYFVWLKTAGLFRDH